MNDLTTTDQEGALQMDRPADRDYCRHGDYVGDDPRICAELQADDAWNAENPPLTGHLQDPS